MVDEIYVSNKFRNLGINTKKKPSFQFTGNKVNVLFLNYFLTVSVLWKLNQSNESKNSLIKQTFLFLIGIM